MTQLVFFSEVGLSVKKKKNTSKSLVFPSNAKSMMSPARGVYAVMRKGPALLSFMGEQPQMLATPFSGIKKTQYQTFGKLLDSKRFDFAKNVRRGTWVGGFEINNKMYVIDGRYLTMLNFGGDKLEFISQRSIPWDAIQPPPDRGGAATRVEFNQTRARFRKAFQKTEGLKIVGVSKDDSRWLKGSNRVFMSTRIKGFPLVTAKCDESSLSCILEHACNINKLGIAAEDVAGLGLSRKRRQIVIGDAKNHRIKKFQFESCFKVSLVGELHLPKKIKGLVSVHVDKEDRLWVVSKVPDDFHNGTVYTWDANQW